MDTEIKFCIDNGEIIDMASADNRRISMKCTKSIMGQPSIDILPRVRYILRTSGYKENFISASLLFLSGTLIIPIYDPEQHMVVIMNQSDKIIRIHNHLPLVSSLNEPESDLSKD